jgi:hypothetical protein
VCGERRIDGATLWAFAEFCDVYEIESDFAAKVEGEFDNMIGLASQRA